MEPDAYSPPANDATRQHLADALTGARRPTRDARTPGINSRTQNRRERVEWRAISRAYSTMNLRSGFVGFLVCTIIMLSLLLAAMITWLLREAYKATDVVHELRLIVISAVERASDGKRITIVDVSSTSQ